MFANFCDSAGLQPQFAAHESFITGIDYDKCGYVLHLAPDKRCTFISQTADCRDLVMYVDYMHLIMCVGPSTWAGAVLVICWSVMLLLLLIVNAELVFAPTILILAERFGMSEFLAGTILLALANSFSDIVMAARTDQDHVTEMYNRSLGAAFFVTACVGGTLLVLRPLHEMRDYVLWPAGCYVTTLFYLVVIVNDDWVSVAEALGCVAICALYVGGAVAMHLWYLWRLQSLGDRSSAQDMELKSNLKQRTSLNKVAMVSNRFRSVAFQAELPRSDAPASKVLGLWSDFIQFIKVVLQRSCVRSVYCRKIYFYSTFTFKILQVLMVPMVNYSFPNQGWCKLTMLVNMFFVPPICLLGLGVTGLVYYLLGLGVSVCAAVAIGFTADVDKPPSYQWVFVYVGLATSTLLSGSAANEMVSAVSTIARLAHIEPPTMGVTVLAWSDGLPDLVANVYILHSGHAHMAMVACFAESILTILLNIAIASLHFNLPSGRTKMRIGTVTPNSVVFLLGLLVLYTISVALAGFQLRRSLGLMMLLIYAVYVVDIVLVELQILHGYGTDHADEQVFVW